MATPTTVPSAQQPNVVSAIQQPSAPIDPVKIRAMGAILLSRFKQYEWDRRPAEQLWERNARQYLGVYDPDILTNMDLNRSRAYPKLTRVKCVSMLSRLMNLLFPADDKNWTIAPSAVPELDQVDLQGILDTLYPPQDPTQQGGMPPAAPPVISDEDIESAIRDFAAKRARRMELEIEDQLQELGGTRLIGYVPLCRKVLDSGIRYGAGVLKGPYVEEQDGRAWIQDTTGKVTAVPKKMFRPRFQFVSLWDYYPDMSAKNVLQMEGQFERVILTRHQLLELKARHDFMPDQIDLAMQQNPTGNYVRRAYETELFALGPQINSASNGNGTSKNKYEAYVWEGYITGRELAGVGANVADEDLQNDVKAQVWIIADTVIKAQLNPWTGLPGGVDIQMYHHFIFEENETFLLGNGLPNIMRDSQMGVCAGTRMVLDNASVQRNVEVNLSLLAADQDLTSIQPDKIWLRDDDDVQQTGNMRAVTPIDLPMHVTEMKAIIDMFSNFADQETFVNVGTGGDMQKGPSEPFRTAAGASMLRGDAALPFKDVVRNFDVFTTSVINAILIFNRNFNDNGNIKGDFQPIARGATSLIAKEVLGAQLDQLAQSLTPEEKQYLKSRELLRARVRVRDLDVDNIVMNDKECDAVDANTAQQAQAQQAQAQQLAQAQIREILASALKDIAQAGKNTAASEALTANTILSALEKGLNPDALTPQEQPDAGTTQPAAQGQPDPQGASPGGGSAQPSNVVPFGPGVGGVEAGTVNPTGGGNSSFASLPPGAPVSAAGAG